MDTKKDYSQAGCLAELIQGYVDYKDPYKAIEAGFMPSEEQMEKIDIRKAVKTAVRAGQLDLVKFFFKKTDRNIAFELFKITDYYIYYEKNPNAHIYQKIKDYLISQIPQFDDIRINDHHGY